MIIIVLPNYIENFKMDIYFMTYIWSLRTIDPIILKYSKI
jgi:hypothetical protein